MYSMEPWGEDRADYRAGVVAAMVGNVWLKKGATALKPADFFASLKGEKEPQTAAEMENNALGWTLAMGGEVISNAK